MEFKKKSRQINPRPHPDREAAANVVRAQLDTVYESQEAIQTGNPYLRSYEDISQPQLTSDVNVYHSAWQDYYQKYYEGYYKHYQEKSPDQPEPQPDSPTDEDRVKLIKLSIKDKLQYRGQKIRRSRHFTPILIGLVIVILVLLLQYGRVVTANFFAYVSPGAINPQNIVINPLSDLTVSTDPRLIIPKINVDAPVIYDVGNDYNSQMAAMAKGVAHFAIPGASSHPGEKGNTVISGHSSNSIFEAGDYKFIFAGLEKLSVGDVIYAHYNGIRYTYAVTKKEVVGPTDVSKLVYETDKPVMTLITCTPLGTAEKRLLVTAEQVSPDPSKATSGTSTQNQSVEMPGNSPTFFEWLFNLFS